MTRRLPTAIVLDRMGSFHVGGSEYEVSGQPVREVVLNPGSAPARIDPNGRYQIGQMYVQFFVPRPLSGRFPLLMWHGGGLSGVTWETTPDGRDGWLHRFLRHGWAVYCSDAVERGRSGFAGNEAMGGGPLFLPKSNPFERFRIGDGPGSYADDAIHRRVLPGNLFPVEAYDRFCRQLAPRWTSTDEAITAAYLALLDEVGPSVIMVHSQAGQFGTTVAEARPDLVRALVLVEPAGLSLQPRPGQLSDMPVLAVYGDYIEQDARWPAMRARAEAYFDGIRRAGGTVDVVDLPARGIRGNSHMLMMDRNSDDIADLIQDWLVVHQLVAPKD